MRRRVIWTRSSPPSRMRFRINSERNRMYVTISLTRSIDSVTTSNLGRPNMQSSRTSVLMSRRMQPSSTTTWMRSKMNLPMPSAIKSNISSQRSRISSNSSFQRTKKSTPIELSTQRSAPDSKMISRTSRQTSKTWKRNTPISSTLPT